MRDTALFAGGSITMGLGLEIELNPMYNDHEWLMENGLQLPLPRTEENKQYWKSHRYSKLVSEKLNLKEFNIHDHYEYQLGGNAMDTLWFVTKDNDKFKDLLDNVKYIFLEIGFIRWWNEEVHGFDNNNQFPTTINEILDYINNPNSEFHVTSLALEWLNKFNQDVFWEESFKKFQTIKQQNPEIEFVIIPWTLDRDNNLLTKKIDDILKDYIIKFDDYNSGMDFINSEKLNISDIAVGFNGDYEYNHRDLHPCVKGHELICEFILKHINKNDKIL
jgi:hypothetical protein